MCLMQIEAGLDTGPGVRVRSRRRSMPPTPRDRSATGWSRWARACCSITSRASRPRPRRRRPVSRRMPTSSRSTSSASIRRGPSAELDRIVRAGDPRPGAWFRAGGQRYKVFGPTTATERVHALGVVGAAGIGTADGTLQPREIQPEGKRRMAWADWRRGHTDDLVIDASTPPSARRLALDALVRIEDGAFAHILVPELLRASGSRRATAASSPSSSTARSGCSARSTSSSPRCRSRRSTISNPRCAPGSGSAPTSCSRDPVACGSRGDRGSRGLPSTRVRERRAARARAHRPAVVVARRTRDRRHRRTHLPSRLDRPPARRHVRSADTIATLALADEAAARDAPSEPDAGHRERRRAASCSPPASMSPAASSSATRWCCATRGDIGALARVREGRATPQDQASQAVVAVLDPQPGERVLDLAAAPGGKSAASAERMRDEGLVVAADVNAGRMRAARTQCAIVSRSHRSRRSWATAASAGATRGSFDRVLLDAPCSGLGVLRRRPDARWRVRPSDVRVLAELQRELIVAAAATLRPGRAARVRGVHASARRRRCRSTSSPRPRSRTSPRSHARRRRGAGTGAARCCCPPTPAPTGCSCSSLRAHRGTGPHRPRRVRAALRPVRRSRRGVNPSGAARPG